MFSEQQLFLALVDNAQNLWIKTEHILL